MTVTMMMREEDWAESALALTQSQEYAGSPVWSSGGGLTLKTVHTGTSRRPSLKAPIGQLLGAWQKTPGIRWFPLAQES